MQQEEGGGSSLSTSIMALQALVHQQPVVVCGHILLWQPQLFHQVYQGGAGQLGREAGSGREGPPPPPSGGSRAPPPPLVHTSQQKDEELSSAGR